jgi:NitT/TauT family transport system substrate-binding protein
MQTIRILLNSAHSGANAWFALTEELGLFSQEGVAVQYGFGSGAYGAARRLMEEPFDLAFGDIHSLVELVAEQPSAAPKAVFCVHGSTPSVIGVTGASAIRSPPDLAGKVILAHASDVALKTFGCFASAAGIDAAAVNIRLSTAPMVDMLTDALAGNADGVFGYYSTQTAVLRARDVALPGKLRFLSYSTIVPDLYGSVIMASRVALRDQRASVTAALRAINRGLEATFRDPRTAIGAVAGRNPAQNQEVELIRLSDTLSRDILHPDTAKVGIGGMDPDRLDRDIALFAATAPLRRRPVAEEVFSGDVLPALGERRYGSATSHTA